MSSKGIKLNLKRNKKLDKIYHSETNLVFKSVNEKVVIGRIENDEIIPLDESCIKLCDDWGLSYDDSLVEQTSSTEENQQQVSEPVVQELQKNVEINIFEELNSFRSQLEKHNTILLDKISLLENKLKELEINYQESLESKRKLKQMINDM